MRVNTLQMKRAVSAVLLVLLLSAVGMTKALAQYRVPKNDIRQATASAKKVAVGNENVNPAVNKFAPQTAKSVVVNRYYEIEDCETMWTTYDLQSNHFCSSRMYQLPNGKVGVVGTMSHESNYFSDRGTGYNFYNGLEWLEQPEERIESMRTGWPTIAQWGDNGEILISHSPLRCWTRQVAGQGEWVYRGELPGGDEAAWPRVATSGDHHNIIHVVADIQQYVYSDYVDYQFYFRSEDAENWTVSYSPLADVGYVPGGGFSADDYTITANGHYVAILYSGSLTNSVWMFKSTNDGITWNARKVWEDPYEGIDLNDPNLVYTDTLYRPMNGAIVIDNNGVAHVALNTFEMAHFADTELGSYTYWFGRTVDGILYWNDTYEGPIESEDGNPHHAARLWWPDEENPGYVTMHNDPTKWIGYIPMYEGYEWNDDQFYHEGRYHDIFYGASGHPTLSCDPQGNLACAFSSPCVKRTNGEYYYRSIYVSYRNVENGYWEQMVDELTDEEINSNFLYSENIFTISAPNTYVPGEFWFGFQSDNQIGLSLGAGVNDPQTGVSENYIHAVKVVHNIGIQIISVTANPTEGGTVTGAGTYETGTTCTLTAIANTGYTFINWTNNGTVVSTNPTYSFTVTENASYVANFELNCYTITATVNPIEGGTVAGGGTYNHGVMATLTATANIGYTFINWTKNGAVVSTNSTYRFIVTENVSYVANFELNIYTITATVNLVEGGTVAGGGTYNHGVTATLTATSNTGYTFTNWTKNGTVVSSSAIYSFTVTGSGTYIANFSLNIYTISASVNPSNGGSVNGGGNYNYGATCTLTATSNSGYTFTDWTKNEQQVSTSATYSFTVTESGNYVANFELNSYTITATANPTEGGAVSGGGTFNHGSTCTMTATANTGYNFINWTENGTVVSTSANYSFTVIGNRNLVANFVGSGDHDYIDLGLPSGLLWATCNVGADTPEGYGHYFAWGETQPKDVYNWSTYQHCNGDYNQLTKYCNNPYYGYNGYTDTLTILLPEDDAATTNWGNDWRMPTKEEWQELYQNTTVTWTQQNGVNGRLFTAPNGNSLFLPAAGWRWDGYLYDVGSDGDYWSSSLCTGEPNYAWGFYFYSGYCNMISGSRYCGLSVRAVRSAGQELTFGITATPNPVAGGAVSGGGAYAEGATCTLTATPAEGYTFINWMENGEVVSTDAEYSFTVTCDRNLVANFSQNTYTISASAIPSNSGSVSGAGNYYYGDTCTLTATPNIGFSFVHWTKNGTHVSTNATYSFTVTENASCVAYFRVNSYIISASVNPAEGGTVSGGGTFNHGSTCTLTATANEDYTFVNWTENDEVVSTDAEYSFMVTGNRNLVANFTSDSGGYYWTVNVNQYPNTMTAIGVILIDDVEQMTNDLELGVFCGTECRGRERLAYISQMDRYLLFLTMYGENGDVLNFRLYDHALGQELDVICTNSVTFATNNTLGTVVSPYEFSFMEGIQTQTSSLPEGWSWWSTYIEQEGIDGLTQLENSLGENGVMIKSQSEGFTSRYGEYWFGLLNSINNESSYLVQTSGSCDVSLTGHMAVPSEQPITLLPGWTWIGYPNNTAMSVSTALSNLNPSENDMLKAQESFSVYYPSIGWFGSLQTIMPGMGLMYESHNTSSVTLTYSNPTRTDDLAENVTARANHWNPDVYAYPNNMNVMAVVEVNGVELQSEDYELAAFANGECRGSAKLMYVEQLHRYMAFLTLHGDDEAELSFGLYDNATGMTAYKSDERLIFAANAVVGSPDNPMVVSFSDMTGIDSFGGTLHVFPNPVERGSMITIGTVEESDEVRVEIMNAVGAVLFTETSTKLPANIKAPEVPGVYMLRITSKGRGTSYMKLIVS